MTDNFELDIQTLSTYLNTHISDFEGPLSAKKFAGGQSNPTYLLNTPKTQYVLRRKPPGDLLKGAHAVDREFKVMSALFPTPLPVAEPLLLCDDDAVIGSMFYVMEYKEGRIFWDPTLPELSTSERGDIYTEMNRVLSELHKVDVDKAGLSEFGKKTDYFARQVHTWTKQYKYAETKHIDAVEQLIEWLPTNIPNDDGQVSIVHGDYRLDNMIFHPDRAEVIAVLDWELSTIGHPYADLAYQCMQYHMPRGKNLPGMTGLDLQELGIPSEQQYVDMYCQRMGIEHIPSWNFYLAFSLFRLAAICQGIEKRRQIGTASSDKAADYAAIVEPLAITAVDLINGQQIT